MNRETLENILRHIRRGGLIVYPTDTLYGLGADIYNETAVRRVFLVKSRPFSQPLPVAVATLDEIEKIAVTNQISRKLAKAFLPGKLTLVMYKRNVPDIVTAGLDKIAVRIPNNRKALSILSHAGPLTVTSANIHGKDVPKTVSEIKGQLGNKDILYIDDGRLEGTPSTIVDCTQTPPKILREGDITIEDIMEVMEE